MSDRKMVIAPTNIVSEVMFAESKIAKALSNNDPFIGYYISADKSKVIRYVKGGVFIYTDQSTEFIKNEQ